MKTTKLTMAQAIVKFLDNQYIKVDGVEIKFVHGVMTIFGHGNVLGLGQALDWNRGGLRYYQGKNEQGMAHVATAFAKQKNRHQIIAVSSSVGPGAANMVTAAATATVNNIPLLLFPGETYASRQPDPVLQQVEQEYNATITTNDAFKPVCKYWDRIQRPEQIMTAMINAMRVLTDPSQAGAVCISIPQDVQGESYDFPDYFLTKRVHLIGRTLPSEECLMEVQAFLQSSKKPLVICGGGVRYSQAGKAVLQFCQQFNIPFAETQAGKSALPSSSEYCLGGIGVTGNLAANRIAKEADLILALGTRLSDFTTASKSLFVAEKQKIIAINTSKFHSLKMDSYSVVGDVQVTIQKLSILLADSHYKSAYTTEFKGAKDAWNQEMDRLTNYSYEEYKSDFIPMVSERYIPSLTEFAELTGGQLTQTESLGMIRATIPANSIITGASGSLPGCLQRMWVTDAIDSYHMEYGYSCMGYEISAALGAKIASPEQEVYAMCGDGSFLMLHSEILTAIQENKKINILLFDNSSNGCINNLQMSNGISNFGTEFRYKDERKNAHLGDMMTVDYAKIGEGYGLKTYTVKTKRELQEALRAAESETRSTLLDIKVLPKTMTHGYEAWWNVGASSVNQSESGKQVYDEMVALRKKARCY